MSIVNFLVLAAQLVLFSSFALSQQVETDDEQPAACKEYEHVPMPATDVPTAQDRKDLASCDAQNLYFGFDRPADPVAARKCAYIQREEGKTTADIAFGGAGLLAMIYANGKGAIRNLDLALKFACESGFAEAEKVGRFQHLLKLKNEHWNGDNFNLCDDATSGFMEAECTAVQDRFVDVKRKKKIEAITNRWSPGEKTAFKELQKVAEVYFESIIENELNDEGTARAAIDIRTGASLEEDFISALKRFERGELPNFSRTEFGRTDAELNSVYSDIQAKGPKSLEMGTVTPAGILKVQRVWLRYREAWVRFGQIRYPAVTPDSWRTWLTRERIERLRALLAA